MTTNVEPQPDTTVARIIAELNANPELKPALLRAMLTEEFLLLPNKVDRLFELYGELADRVDQLTDRVDRLTTTVDQLTTTVSRLANAVIDLADRVAALENKVNWISGQLGNLLGERYECHVSRFIRSKAHSDLNIRRAKVLLGETTTDYETLIEAAIDGRAAGIVTMAQTDSLQLADYVLYGTDLNTGQPRAAAVEVSITLEWRDIQRALERANILAQIMDCPAVAAVVGNSIKDTDLRRAEADGVVVLIIAE